MKQVWKFPLGAGLLAIHGETKIHMPVGADVLCIREQYGVPCIWALVDPDAPLATRTFRTYGTGHEVSEAHWSYIGTTIHMQDSLVLHTFEVLPQ